MQFGFSLVVEAGSGDDDLKGVADVVVHLLDDGGALALAAQFALLLALEQEDQGGGDEAEEDVVDAGRFRVEAEATNHRSTRSTATTSLGRTGRNSEPMPRHFVLLPLAGP